MNMEAADGGSVKVLLPQVRSKDVLFGIGIQLASLALLICVLQPPQAHDVTDTFVEIVGTVIDATTIKFLTCINMGSKLGETVFHFHHDNVIDIEHPSRHGYGEPSHRANV